jgi:hypothetical protein
MSQPDDTFTQQIQQHLEAIKEGGKDQDWLRDLVQWLLQ